MRSIVGMWIVCLFLLSAFAGTVAVPVEAVDGSRATDIIDIVYSSPSSATLGYSDYEMWLTLDNLAYKSPDYLVVRNCSAKLIDVIDPEGKSVGTAGGPFTFTKTENDLNERVNITSGTRDLQAISFDMKTTGKQGKFEFKVKFTFKTEKGSDPQQSAEETDSVFITVSSGVTASKRALVLEDVGRIYTGTEFQHVGISVSNNLGMEIETVTATLDLKVTVPWLINKETYPSISLQDANSMGISSTSSYIKSMSSYSTELFNYRIAVKSDTTPGIYPAYLSVQFTRELNDKDTIIVTQGIPVEIAVEFTPLVSIVSPESFSVVQGASTTALNSVVVRNVGNADLTRFDFWIDIYNYFELNDFYYEGEGGDKVPDAEKKSVASLPKGSETSLSFTDLKLFKYLPQGEHRIKLRYEGFYFNDGTSGDPSGFVETDDQTYRTIMGEDLYIDVLVQDSKFDLSVQSSNSLTLGGTEKDIGITVSVTNREAVDVLYATFSLSCTPEGTTTPLIINSKDPGLKYILAPEVQRFAALSTVTMTFNADLVEGAGAGFYDLPLTVDGYDADSREPLNPSITVSIPLRVNPPPPRLEITDVQAPDIKPGEAFTMTLKVTNTGGSTATGVSLSIGDPDREDDYSSGNGDFTPEVAFAEDTLHPFSTRVSIKYVADISAGETATISFMMNASDKTVTGKYYEQTVTINCRDGFGRTFASAPTISMQVPGELPSKPVPPPDYTPLLYPLMIGMILVVLAFGLAMVGYRVYRKHRKEDMVAGATARPFHMDTADLEPQARPPATHQAPAPAPTKPAQQRQEQHRYAQPQYRGQQQQEYYAQQQPQQFGQPEAAAGYQYSAEVPASDDAHQKVCVRCGRQVASGMQLCPYCGTAV